MKKYLLLSIVIVLVTFISFSQTTTKQYLETFNSNRETGWAFIADGNVSIQNGELKFASLNDNIVHMVMPIGATKDDFSFKVISGSTYSAIEGGGFGRSGFKSMLAIMTGYSGDSISVVYTPDIQSYYNPNFIQLYAVKMPVQINSLQLTAVRSANNLIVKAFVNDVKFYEGELTNVDEGLFTGQMFVYTDGEDGRGGQMEWTCNEVEINYNPMITTPGVFLDEFTNADSPWLKFGVAADLGQAVTISGGKMNFNFNGVEYPWLYAISPVGSVGNFSIEVEGGAGASHNAPFEISRFNDYRNYTTMFFEDDTMYVAYAIDSYEPTIINKAKVDPSTLAKIKFSVEGTVPNLTLRVWTNNVLLLTGVMNNATEKLGNGHIAMGYSRGNRVNAYLNNASINYSSFTTSVKSPDNLSITEFALHQNYPNPFNPTTTIKYDIPVGTYNYTSLRVYDILGKEVATLVNEQKEAGSYEVTFNASKLASGIYFYKLTARPNYGARPNAAGEWGQAGSFSSVKKLMLLK